VARQSLDEFLTHARSLVDAALDRHLPVPPACPTIVAEAMRYSVFAGGKRLRPMLTLAAADAIARRGPDSRPGAQSGAPISGWVFDLSLRRPRAPSS
jgi:geranylgeranyl diphosphate synthase type II